MNPFEVARLIGTNLNEAVVSSRDKKNISNILNQFSNDVNPESENLGINEILSNVSPGRQQQAIQALSMLRQNAMQQQMQQQQMQQQQQQRQYYQSQGYGEGFESLPSEERRVLMQQKGKAPESAPVQKIYEKAATDRFAKDLELIPVLESSLSNLERLKELGGSGAGAISRYVQSALGTGNTAEINTLGFAAIEPVLKIFNPVGAVPVAKMNILTKKFAPQANDTAWTYSGKIQTLERLGKAALERAEQRTKLFESYGGQVPPREVLYNFDKETSKLAENLIDAESKNYDQLVKQEPKQGSKNIPLNTIDVL